MSKRKIDDLFIFKDSSKRKSRKKVKKESKKKQLKQIKLFDNVSKEDFQHVIDNQVAETQIFSTCDISKMKKGGVSLNPNIVDNDLAKAIEKYLGSIVKPFIWDSYSGFTFELKLPENFTEPAPLVYSNKWLDSKEETYTTRWIIF